MCGATLAHAEGVPAPPPTVGAGPFVAPAPTRLAPGSRVDLGWAQVVVGAVLGDGGMGVVYRGWLFANPIGPRGGEPPREVALKIVHPQLLGRTRVRKLFYGEIEALRRLSHPNVVALVGFHDGGERGPLALALELVEGDTLSAIVARHVARATPGGLPAMPFVRAWHYFEQLLGALAATHALGIVHRDVKSANLLVRRDGVVKLADFGIARLPTDAMRLTGGIPPGTGAYMSPEQVMGQGVDGRSDLYAAAIVLFEMVAGVTPFDSPDRSEIAVRTAQVDEPPPSILRFVPQAPPVLDALFARALAKERGHRFGGAIEMGEAFRTALGLPLSPGWVAQQRLAASAPAIVPTPRQALAGTAPMAAVDAEVLRGAVAGAYAGGGAS